MKNFCRTLNALRGAEEAIRLLETHQRAGLLSRELLVELEWQRSVQAELEPLVICYYDDPGSLPQQPPHLDYLDHSNYSDYSGYLD